MAIPSLDLKFRLTLLEPMLGTACADPDVHREYIASQAPEPEKTEEEVEAVDVAEKIERAKTVFARDGDEQPILWDYQIKGFFKGACGALRRVKGTKSAGAAMKAYKKVVDGLIFVNPRKILLVLPDGEKIGECVRPLRAQTAKGERVALATSETVPAGTTLEFVVSLLDPKHEDVLLEWLRYGDLLGLGQWRSSGKGRFSFEALGSTPK